MISVSSLSAVHYTFTYEPLRTVPLTIGSQLRASCNCIIVLYRRRARSYDRLFCFLRLSAALLPRPPPLPRLLRVTLARSKELVLAHRISAHANLSPLFFFPSLFAPANLINAPTNGADRDVARNIAKTELYALLVRACVDHPRYTNI